MNRQIVHAFGGFHNAFGNGRVRVDRASEFVGGRLQLHRDAGFREEFGRVRSDDVDAQDFVVFFVGDNFDEAVGFAQDARFARSRERKFSDFDVVAFLFGFGFC